MHNDGLALVGVLAIPSRPGVAGRILSALGDQRINVQFIVQTVDHVDRDHVVFCVCVDDLAQTLDLLQPVREAVLGRDVVCETGTSTISIFGPDFRQRPGIAGQMFAALGRIDINIKAISTSTSTITCVIPTDRMAEALRALEDTFEVPC